MEFVLLKDYLTTDGVEIPAGTKFLKVRLSRTDTEMYRATIANYKHKDVGPVERRILLPIAFVEGNSKWFDRVGYWYVSDCGTVMFDSDKEGFNSGGRKRFGNYFDTELEATATALGIKLYLKEDMGPIQAKRQTHVKETSGKVAQKMTATEGTYDKVIAGKPGEAYKRGGCIDETGGRKKSFLTIILTNGKRKGS